MATDEDVLSRIKELVSEEHDLRGRRERGEIGGPEEHQRLERLEVELDRCWDLLRQRRALRDAARIPPPRPRGPVTRSRATSADPDLRPDDVRTPLPGPARVEYVRT